MVPYECNGAAGVGGKPPLRPVALLRLAVPRAYLRLDPAFDERKESYPDGPYAALIATFCLAELQPQRGRFRSRDYLTRLLGRRGRHVKFLLEHHDLEEQPDGRVYVIGWDEWQEGDWKVAERVGRIRARRGDTVNVTPDVTVDVTLYPPKATETDSKTVAVSGSGASTPLPPASGGSGLRADDDSPRQRAERAKAEERERRRQEGMALQQRYLRNDINREEYDRLLADIGKEPDDLTRLEIVR